MTVVALNRHDWCGFLSVWLLEQQPCSAPTQVPGGLVQSFTDRRSRRPGPCLPALMPGLSTAALQCSCDFFIIIPREAACPHISNLLLIQESSVVVALNETAMGGNRQENTNVNTSAQLLCWVQLYIWESFLFSDCLFHCAGIFLVLWCLSYTSLPLINLFTYKVVPPPRPPLPVQREK